MTGNVGLLKLAGESNQKRYEEDGAVVLVTEIDAASKKGHKVIRGTADKLIGQLTEDPESLDSTSPATAALASPVRLRLAGSDAAPPPDGQKKGQDHAAPAAASRRLARAPRATVADCLLPDGGRSAH